MRKYLIRFNTVATGDHDKWRVIEGEIEHLVSEININVPSKTSTNEIVGVGLKYHIACEGILTLEGLVASIN